MDYGTIIRTQRQFLATQKPVKIGFRLNALVQLKKAILKYEKELIIALRNDLGKSEFESYASEVGLVMKELDYAIKHLCNWTKPKKYPSLWFLWPSKSLTINEPYGIVLIIAPWNYPFQLLFSPLIGAIAAGNCVVLKPSPDASHTLAVTKKIIKESFDSNYVTVIDGANEETAKLLEIQFDYIFFTGGSNYGREVMKAAARYLTPIALELGGKSPCVVSSDAHIDVAARRIVWGKFLNCGQTCVAPDYILVQSTVKEKLIEALSREIELQFGSNAQISPDYPRIINEKNVMRLESLLQGGRVIVGGVCDPQDRYVAPTLLDEVKPNSEIMQHEIFGPILPILPYDTLDEAIEFINKRDKPLALYFFTQCQPDAFRMTKSTSSGAICVNDVVMHVANFRLPFGGVGNSGMGAYHGKNSYDTFSHTRSIMHLTTNIDIPIRYAPHTVQRFKWLKRFL